MIPVISLRLTQSETSDYFASALEVLPVVGSNMTGTARQCLSKLLLWYSRLYLVQNKPKMSVIETVPIGNKAIKRQT